MIGSKPTHKVLAVSDRSDSDNGNKSYWTRIGAAWPAKNGRGLSIVLDALPLNGRLVVLEVDDEEPPAPAPAKSKKERAT